MVLWKIILDIGWVMMIVFQSLVLYSRLHLVFDEVRIIQGVKWMIVFTTCAFIIPVVTLDFGTYIPWELGSGLWVLVRLVSRPDKDTSLFRLPLTPYTPSLSSDARLKSV